MAVVLVHFFSPAVCAARQKVVTVSPSVVKMPVVEGQEPPPAR
jgi:hypothetical protein